MYKRYQYMIDEYGVCIRSWFRWHQLCCAKRWEHYFPGCWDHGMVVVSNTFTKVEGEVSIVAGKDKSADGWLDVLVNGKLEMMTSKKHIYPGRRMLWKILNRYPGPLAIRIISNED